MPKFLIVLLFIDYDPCYKKTYELEVEIWVYFITKIWSRTEQYRLDLFLIFRLGLLCKTCLKTFNLSFCTTAFALQIWQNTNKIINYEVFSCWNKTVQITEFILTVVTSGPEISIHDCSSVLHPLNLDQAC